MFLFENEIRRKFLSLGLIEFLTCDLISPKLDAIAREIVPHSMETLQSLYSKSEEFSILRISLLPGLMQVLQGNLAKKNTNIAAFEIGKIHFKQANEIIEMPMAAILLTGKKETPHWSCKSADFDYFDLKGMLENLFQATYAPSHHLSFHPQRQADIYIADMMIGSFGQIHPTLLAKFDIEEPVYYAEINLSHLKDNQQTHPKIRALPQFPASERDWTIPLDLKTPFEKVFAAIKQQHSPLLEKVQLIDLYAPEGATQKNATFRFSYRDYLKTISFDEVEEEHAKIMNSVVNLLAK
jgi:phenylalanyl-tRNA synthetase beta chain